MSSTPLWIPPKRMDTPAPEQTYVVRYGNTRIVGEFAARGLSVLARGSQVIVRSDRGAEWGTVLCSASEQTRTYLGTSSEHGRVLRLASPEDEVQRDRVAALEREEFATCRALVLERNLQMQLVDVEHVFGGERIIFYYVAEQRIDFRELVKALARTLNLRIEMRQIGVRDEAKLLADYGDCGKPVCCNTYLREMPPVSMKMAKLQKATLDPNKISGRCGRLKCCLRYEYDTYEAHRKELPPVGATVLTKQGTGRVVGQELLAKKLMVAYEGSRYILTSADDVITVVSTRSGGSQNSPHDSEGEGSPGAGPREEREPRPPRRGGGGNGGHPPRSPQQGPPQEGETRPERSGGRPPRPPRPPRREEGNPPASAGPAAGPVDQPPVNPPRPAEPEDDFGVMPE